EGANELLRPRAPVQLRNHAKENVRLMREKERQMRGKQIMESQAAQLPKEVFKLRQFSEAKSRLFHDVKSNSNLPRPGQGGDMCVADFEAEVEELIRKHGKEGKDGGKPLPKQAFVKDADNCPAYIRKMKEAKADEEERAEAEHNKPRAPPGFRILPAQEVKETLTLLNAKHVELEKEFQRLPLKIETDGQKRRQTAVLDKIDASSKAIALFSRPTVMVEG
ncbi:unnamed protein product, partial [Polarella glacialis]